MRWGSSFFIGALMVACGSSSDGSGGEPSGECRTPFDCESGSVCIPSEYDGPIPGKVEEGVAAVCTPLPPMVSLLYREFAPGISSVDGFVVAPGLYRHAVSYRLYAFETTSGASYDTELPYWPRGPMGQYVDFGLEYYTRVVGLDDPSFDVECNLTFNELGELIEGGVVLGPGEHGVDRTSTLLVCPTNDPGSQGILIETEFGN